MYNTQTALLVLMLTLKAFLVYPTHKTINKVLCNDAKQSTKQSEKINLNLAYAYKMDLIKCFDDKVQVKLKVNFLDSGAVLFCFPAIVPGAYTVNNFGRFVSNFKVNPIDGKTVDVIKVDVNTYNIQPAEHIKSISYSVDDTYDSNNGEGVFEPVGSMIDSNNVFILNPYCFFGFFKGYTEFPIEIEISKPDNFYPSTSLKNILINKNVDRIKSDNYYELVDNPVLYCKADTASLKISNTKISISVYIKSKTYNSKLASSTVKKIIESHAKYLGNTLPVDNYTFLVYVADQATPSKSYGALEHCYSSLYVLPSADSGQVSNLFQHMSAHELFHIITPLHLRSKEIHRFDFTKPNMSQHLWLYEGITEYITCHSRLLSGLITNAEFRNILAQKYKASTEKFCDTLSFTKMSKNAVDQYAPQYNNVYFKGALIGMCLDILLVDHSNGNYNLRHLLNDLMIKYGKNNPFDDCELFDVIAKVSFLQTRDFFMTYVEGSNPLPVNKYLNLVGLEYKVAEGKPIIKELNETNNHQIDLRSKWLSY